MWVFLAFVGGALLVLLVANLTTSEKKIEHEIEHLYPVGDPQFVRSLGTLLGPAILPGNRITALINGDQIFPAMLEAVRGATRTITFETFIYWSGAIGKAVAGALIERAQAGVSVHVLLDWVGAGRMDDALLQKMKQTGIAVVKYHPLHWYNLGRLNNRTHRKLLVVDGTVGFTGGVGIADTWLGNAEDPEHWRDSHFKVEGPAVAQMQAAFGQLDRGDGRGAPRRRVLSRAHDRRYPSGTDVQELGQRGQRERAADVPAVDRIGREERSYRECLLRAR